LAISSPFLAPIIAGQVGPLNSGGAQTGIEVIPLVITSSARNQKP
jgi:hypothetical protein